MKRSTLMQKILGMALATVLFAWVAHKSGASTRATHEEVAATMEAQIEKNLERAQQRNLQEAAAIAQSKQTAEELQLKKAAQVRPDLVKQLERANLIMEADHFLTDDGTEISLYQVKTLDQMLQSGNDSLFGGPASCAYQAIKNGFALLTFAIGLINIPTLIDRLLDTEFALTLFGALPGQDLGQWRQFVNATSLQDFSQLDPEIQRELLLNASNWLAPDQIKDLIEQIDIHLLQRFTVVADVTTEIKKVQHNFPQVIILGDMQRGARERGHWIAVLIALQDGIFHYIIANSIPDKRDFLPLTPSLTALIAHINGKEAIADIEQQQVTRLERGLRVIAQKIQPMVTIGFTDPLFTNFNSYFSAYTALVDKYKLDKVLEISEFEALGRQLQAKLR